MDVRFSNRVAGGVKTGIRDVEGTDIARVGSVRLGSAISLIAAATLGVQRYVVAAVSVTCVLQSMPR